MLLSIIVPVYNVKAYLRRCLESIAAQTLKDYEVIAVDDGSTDGSGELLDAFCAGKERFRVFHKENGGLMSAWMEGVSHARGRYFGFVDSDDYIAGEMFARMTDCALRHDCDIVMCDRYDVRGETMGTSHACIRPGLYREADMAELYRKTLPTFGGAHITNARWNKIFKRELFLENTKYCEHRSRICEDRFITPACMFSARSFYYLDVPLYYYVFRAGSNHSKASPQLQDAMELLYETQKRMLRDKGMLEEYGACVERANLNYLRLMIQRNFSGEGDRELRKKLAARILQSGDYRRCVKRYGEDLSGRFGSALKVLFFVNSPALFVDVCRFVGQ